MEKLRLIFVDDESGILATMRRIMFRKRTEWQVDFATSGAEGLELVCSTFPNVVVSDMRMPGMDGVEFLTHVARIQPGTIRIIMTGHSSQEAFLRSVGPVHLILYKPVEAEQFMELMDRLRFLFSLPISEAGRNLLGSITALPPVPQNHSRLMNALGNPFCTFELLSEIIGSDPALAAKLLHLINSAHFGVARRVVKLDDAVRLLGIDIIRSLALGTSFFARFDGQVDPLFVSRLARHCLQVAEMAKWIAHHLSRESQVKEEAFLAGLLHEIGQLVHVGQGKGAENDQGALGVERQLQGWMGAFLLGLWGLPEYIMNVAAYHHNPQLSLLPRCPVLLSVHLACARVCQTPVNRGVLEASGIANIWPDWERELARSPQGREK